MLMTIMRISTEMAKAINEQISYEASCPNDPNAGKQFNSGLLAEGTSVTHTFKKAGEFNYFCLIHPDMIGKVIVR